MFKPDAIYYENAIKGYELGVYLLEKYILIKKFKSEKVLFGA